MSTTKKKTKIAKIPKPIKVKKEKTEDCEETLYPMSHYIDDRLELTKQIISTLKPKTITNLAPDFLKERSLEDIEELCLNELLGISTKRLLSIINATKCPTDTESSTDSDVNNIEEHISLEEISSDSEVEKNLKSPAKIKTFKTSTGDGKINVLELLELQARARAIRSQLALEPVTKIDVDSDDEPVSKNNSKEHRKSNKINSKNSVSNLDKAKNSTNGSGTNSVTTETENTSTTVVPRQKIKLKRNFRKRTEINDDDESKAGTSNVQDIISDTLIKEEKRSQSPDVIPILPVTETLYISDSSSDEKPLTEKGEEVNKEGSVANCDKTNNACQQRKLSEAEDGEITDDDDCQKKQVESEKIDMVNKTAETETQPMENNDSDKLVVSNEKPLVSEVAENDRCNENSATKVEEDIMVKPQHLNLNKTNEPNINRLDKAQIDGAMSDNLNNEIIIGEDSEVDDNEHNDDVISIEGGDLESEMIEHLEDSKSMVSETLTRKTNVEDDVITLDDSSSEEYNELKNQKSESWNARWLKSSKVSKVLATSRLGNRLRDKIKKSKRSQELARQEEEELAQKNLITSVVISRHELGSVEQYKELAEMQKRI